MTTLTTTYSTAGSGSWLCPDGVTSISVANTGGGGGGWPGSTTGGPGGGGGEYAGETALAVTPGRTYKWAVGTGGTGGQHGGDTTFTGDTLTVTAHGGSPGLSSGGGNGGTGSSNSTHHNGGGGGLGAANGAGGGGGSSASSSSYGGDGGQAYGTTGGHGGTAPAGGGDGGAGGYDGIGGSGSSPGGGGGGSGGSPSYGGHGADGQIVITYTASTQPQIPDFPAGYGPLPSDFDAWIQAPLSFLTSRVVFRAALTQTQTWYPGTTVIAFNDIIEDPWSGWQSGSHQWQAPAGYSGIYLVTLTITALYNSAQPVLSAVAGVNSQAYSYTAARCHVPPSSGAGMCSGIVPVRLYGGTDTVQGLVGNPASSNASDVTTSGQQAAIEISWYAS